MGQTDMKQPYPILPQKGFTVCLCQSKEPCVSTQVIMHRVATPSNDGGNPFKTVKAELGENGKMYFTTDFFLEQSLQKDFKSYIKHCFDSMCF